MSKLVSTERTSPNGEKYLELKVHNQIIGSARKVDDGYLVPGRKKPVATLKDAAKQCLDKQISRHSNEIQKLRGMLATVLSGN